MDTQERLLSLKDLLRRAEKAAPAGPEDDYRRRRSVEDGPAAPSEVVPTSAAIEDWSGTLDLINSARDRLVTTEHRVGDLERELNGVRHDANDQIERLQTQVAELQRDLTEALEGRRHAEDWLRRLNDAVRERFAEAVAPEQESERDAARAS
jgi:chromosome segregation ATPase